jgi:hypothetical protein
MAASIAALCYAASKDTVLATQEHALMRKTIPMAVLFFAAMLAAHAQRQVAAPVTDRNDPKFLTAQTRKMGGPMPPEQLALTFDHLDLAMKVFPDQQRIEAVATLRLKTKARIETLILDLFPKFTITGIDVDGSRTPTTAFANREGQLRITLTTPFEAGKTFEARIAYSGTPPLAKRPPWEGGTTWTRTPDGKSPWIDTSLWGRRLRPALPVPRSSDAEAGNLRSPLHRADRLDGARQRCAGQQGRQGRLDDVELARSQHPHLWLRSRRRSLQSDGRRLPEIVCLGSDGRSRFYDLMFRREWPGFVAFDALRLTART